MKPIIMVLAAVALCATSCGGGDAQACRDYCTKMATLTCFGNWVCVTVDKKDNLGRCAVREVFSYTESDVVTDGDIDFDGESEASDALEAEGGIDGNLGSTTYVCTPTAATPAGRASIPEGVEVPDSARETRVFNPANLAECESLCEVETQSDSLPKDFESEFSQADSCNKSATSFLQAQLNQQCRLEAEEK
ncbi:MAG: hypothetical protein C4523_07545 [Myxococcales bacterium]|nr:MAG: hypothetical protein C4523_07545 [Myxococcales bacterium]